jgi:hypothetical protein
VKQVCPEGTVEATEPIKEVPAPATETVIVKETPTPTPPPVVVVKEAAPYGAKKTPPSTTPKPSVKIPKKKPALEKTPTPTADDQEASIETVPVVQKIVKKVVPKKKIVKVVPKKAVEKKCVPVVNVTEPEPVNATAENDTDIVDKKNKIEYLDNLEKDLNEAKAKITKQKEELNVKKAIKILNKSKNAKKVNATKVKIETIDNASNNSSSIDTAPVSNGTITQEDVDKAENDGQDIVKD